MAELKLYEVESRPGVISLQQFTPETAKRLNLKTYKPLPVEEDAPAPGGGDVDDVLGEINPAPTGGETTEGETTEGETTEGDAAKVDATEADAEAAEASKTRRTAAKK